MTTVEQDTSRAKETYASHTIMDRSDGRFLIARPDGGNFWTEIIRGTRGAVIITGDGPDIIFRSWRTQALESLVRWVASGVNSLGYIQSKVVCGSRDTYDGELAREHIRGYLDDAHHEDLPDYQKALAEFADDDSNPWGDHEEIPMREALAEIDPDSFEWHVGRRPSVNLINAVAACARLVELIDAEGDQ